MVASAILMLHLTGRCNLECKHCYMEGSPKRKERLPFEWIEQCLLMPRNSASARCS